MLRAYLKECALEREFAAEPLVDHYAQCVLIARRARLVLLAGLRVRARRSPAYREAAGWLAARPVDDLLAETRRSAD